jgi:hypothetical protein
MPPLDRPARTKRQPQMTNQTSRGESTAQSAPQPADRTTGASAVPALLQEFCHDWIRVASDEAAVATGQTSLPRRDAYSPPDWWTPYAAEFPRWRAWERNRLFWARLPGTMRVHHAEDPAALARQICTADDREER